MDNKDSLLKPDQVVEVDYDPELVREYIEHDGEIIEGVGADDVDAPMYGIQTTVNEDPIEELLGEGAEIDDEYKNN